ncbi:ABC transporter ATP-binding protein [Bacillus pseudomycoides]|jgi:ABC-2 type transport system ATP-binding protein|uniref:ABC transporter ATP-binding protein n=1 Tax=Bacillus pseudomycoides TaxID=64104 RepID=A0AAJ1Z710_9BACI|nr:ABC transporter ATP-binding protein [Bacillus pseudomycoides]EEM03058.1 ABC transporter, ATP-binding protein [Bacillus pseudomycoides]EEM08654.1 ABC transporter, ATP-binding protein [Bacillus pseudomycoides]MBD5799461.1 ABC transporter ATP-binding protein [Bacillus pseudomycoides]MCR8860809.1 ABC transporter ATP-binding protein [Bacillus pseudomycoides]MDR4327546.1 ABC transporter ATP-binding protein [Bacillus pseudomycoides]
MGKIIEVNGVSKTFKHKKAVNNVSFHVEKGQIVALLGPNGAGKTTTISMMLGLKDPSEGSVSIFGKSPKQRAVRNRLGAMLQEVSVIDSISVEEAIDLFRSYYTNPVAKETLLQLSNLESEKRQRCEKLSGGQKRRLNFALALAGNPDLLFLDEPTVGMDITSRKAFWETIRKLASEGKTIILTTHYLEEADVLADRILLFANGEIIADGTPEEMKATISRKTISFYTKEKIPTDLLKGLPHVTAVQFHEPRVILTTDDTDATLQAIYKENLPVTDISVERGSLDEAFEQFVANQKEGIV